MEVKNKIDLLDVFDKIDFDKIYSDIRDFGDGIIDNEKSFYYQEISIKNNILCLELKFNINVSGRTVACEDFGYEFLVDKKHINIDEIKIEVFNEKNKELKVNLVNYYLFENRLQKKINNL